MPFVSMKWDHCRRSLAAERLGAESPPAVLTAIVETERCNGCVRFRHTREKPSEKDIFGNLQKLSASSGQSMF